MAALSEQDLDRLADRISNRDQQRTAVDATTFFELAEVRHAQRREERAAAARAENEREIALVKRIEAERARLWAEHEEARIAAETELEQLRPQLRVLHSLEQRVRALEHELGRFKPGSAEALQLEARLRAEASACVP